MPLAVLVAPNAFKGSLSAAQAAAAMAAGVTAAAPGAMVHRLPVADGGDGFLDVLEAPLGAERRVRRVRGPLGEPVEATWLLAPGMGLAVVELARASGLALVPKNRRDPLAANTLGAGELVRTALDAGARRILLGLGGSATVDGGTGLAAALGVRFLDAAGHELEPSGAALERVAAIDTSGLDPRLARVTLEAACDVDNPLTGPRGAARVFAPQKGADPGQVRRLERGLAALARAVARSCGREVAELPCAGAAGGTGAVLAGVLGARLRPGAALVLDELGFDAALAGADLVLTGEGALDEQTRGGKAPAEVARRAGAAGVPCIAIAGRVPEPPPELPGLTAAFGLCPPPLAVDECMAQAERLLRAATERAVHAFLAGRSS